MAKFNKESGIFSGFATYYIDKKKEIKISKKIEIVDISN